MSLSTKNASAVVGGASSQDTRTVTVEVLKRTRVQSLGRDVRVGEIVTISVKDFNYLKPYGYITPASKSAQDDSAQNEGSTEDSTEDSTEKEQVKAPVKAQGKRK